MVGLRAAPHPEGELGTADLTFLVEPEILIVEIGPISQSPEVGMELVGARVVLNIRRLHVDGVRGETCVGTVGLEPTTSASLTRTLRCATKLR
jgi:hypothetical protein